MRVGQLEVNLILRIYCFHPAFIVQSAKHNMPTGKTCWIGLRWSGLHDRCKVLLVGMLNTYILSYHVSCVCVGFIEVNLNSHLHFSHGVSFICMYVHGRRHKMATADRPTVGIWLYVTFFVWSDDGAWGIKSGFVVFVVEPGKKVMFVGLRRHFTAWDRLLGR